MMKVFLSVLMLLFLGSCKEKLTNKPGAKEISQQLSLVAHAQMNNFTYKETGNLHDYGIAAWTNAVLYLGMAKWLDTTTDVAAQNWLNGIGEIAAWKTPANFKDYEKYQLYHADELCIAQFYLHQYEKQQKNDMLIDSQNRADWIRNNPPDSCMNHKNKQSWSWCDALFMAPPVYAQLAQITQNESYLQFMDEQFQRTYQHLYDQDERLFFRDDSYFDKREANGEKVFWGRGNAWVAGGLTNILKALPKDSSRRFFYEELLKDLLNRLIELQSTDGFWHASLLDPKSYPSPETSATALITYALAYGINAEILPQKEYLPATFQAWQALSSTIDDKGKLGFVQPIGADPKKVTKDMTAPYGVGAFLLAGSEMLKLKELSK